MSYAVSISYEAEEDLRSIYFYIMFNLFSPQNARDQINRIEKAIQTLDKFPKRNRLVSFEPWKSRGLHIMPCDNFLIFYIVNEEKAEVIVSRVLYGKRNIKKELDK